ncbi:hypothetical protein ABT024_39155, partial [Streptomyces sp. NPDC002812]|uniref:hypothetical protein n=1 Tax=Streptomyces sp. NPDC002812 TaxID=3154434 RepID=UPI003331A6A1
MAVIVRLLAKVGVPPLPGSVPHRRTVSRFDNWYSISGGTALIKAHNHRSRPTTFSCDSEVQSE